MKGYHVHPSILSAAFLAVAGLTTAYAVPTPLPMGSGDVVPGVAAAAPSGTLVASTGPIAFVGVGGTISGTLETSVWADDPANPFAGGLTFTYLLNNTSADESIARLTLPDWGLDAGAIVAAETDGTAIVPDSVDRNNTGGTVIGWEWDSTPLAAGSSSALLILYTPATAWQASVANVIDGDVAQVASYAPAVPDGGFALAMLGAGVAVLGVIRQKRQ